MKLAIVTGTATATTKDSQLVGATLLVCDCIDGKGKVLQTALVAVDTVGAGVGDKVLITTGSAARLPAQTTGIPADAAIIAIVDDVTLSTDS